MGRTEFTVKLKPLIDLEKRMKDPALVAELSRIADRTEVAALVAQAIADNFDKEGPGWAPLKGATIRLSVAKNAATNRLIKDAYMHGARKIGAVKRSKSGKESLDRQAMREYRRKDKTQKTFLGHVDSYIEGIEKSARSPRQPDLAGGDNEPLGNRQILRRTSLLYQTVTTVGFSGSSGPTAKNPNIKSVSGQNIHRTEGTNLIWGTNLIYAATHNEGDPDRGIPKREFLVIRKEWERRLYDYVKSLMTKTIIDFVTGAK